MVDEIDDSNSKIIRDMSQYFIEKIARIMDEIDELKKSLMYDKRNIVFINERLNALFIEIIGKMGKREEDYQMRIRAAISEIPIGKWKNTLNSSGDVQPTFLLHKVNYARYNNLVEQREVHLKRVFERIGMTASEKQITRKIH